jgi:hypothetical protein
MGPTRRITPYNSELQAELLSTSAQVADWRLKLEAERPIDPAQETRDKIYFGAGRYSAGARDSIAVAAWLAIGEELM